MKRNKENALICELCKTIWFDNEIVNSRTGHNLRSYLNNYDQELNFDEISDFNDRPIVESDIR